MPENTEARTLAQAQECVEKSITNHYRPDEVDERVLVVLLFVFILRPLLFDWP